ncbi:MAG: WGxxGxxG-CTERM domain-containing protein [Acidobacteria bacterium]|nr:WGxxGxxG-CTERM domain-containing protein [Acidobacteriota bacterium]
MKRILCKYATLATLALCLTGLSATASAQNTNSGVATPAPVTRTDTQDDRDYGWIGLVGLLGLAGLLGRRDTRTVHRDTEVRTKREN